MDRTLKDSMRSTLYDTVSDRYPRFLRDESWRMCRPNTTSERCLQPGHHRPFFRRDMRLQRAWQMPDQFSRVITWIGSFASIQWKEDANNADGGRTIPTSVAGTEA